MANITGTIWDDVLVGTIDDDLLEGLEGNDELTSDQGNDTLNGGSGDDILKADEGNDLLNGGEGNDTLYGNSHHDILNGDQGNDLLLGGWGADTVNGGLGSDELEGGVGNDLLNGGEGNDTLNGNEDQDIVNGDQGNDLLLGGLGPDILNGGLGSDELKGGEGNDLLNGGEGNDTLNGNKHQDLVNGDQGNDLLNGGWGSDTLNGGLGSDELKGDVGNDLLISRSDAGEPLVNSPDIEADDTLTGDDGSDNFRFEFLVNAKESIITKHADPLTGYVDWEQIVNENNATHDHWVESIGNDVIMDYNLGEGDKIEVIGHSVNAAISYVDEDSDGTIDYSLIELISSETGESAHNGDILGSIKVYGDQVQLSDLNIQQDIIGSVTAIEVDSNIPISIDPTDQIASRDFILNGVSSIHGGNNPGKLLLYTDQSYGIVDYPDGSSPFVAAAAFGLGRAIALPDEKMLDMNSWGDLGDTGRFYINSLQWLTETTSRTINIVTYSQNAATWLTSQRFTNVIVTDESNLQTALTGADVFLGWLGTSEPVGNIDALKAFANNGGGLFMAEYGESYNSWDKSDSPANILLREVGIGFTKGSYSDFDLIDTVNLSTTQITVNDIIAVLNDYSTITLTEFEQKIGLISDILEILPSEDSLRIELETAFANRLNTINPTPNTPVSDAYEKALLTEEMSIVSKLPVNEVTAHRTAEAVFGDIPDDVSLISQNITLDTTKSGWHSTGLYVVPGEVVTLTLPESMVNQGYQIVINSNRDNISGRDSWSRVPFGTSSKFNIDSTTVQIANAFGGAIYLDLGVKPANIGYVNVGIENAIAAPMFVLGETTDEEWINSIRNNPAPYAELVSDGVILSVPSSVIRDLDNPTQLMTEWNRVVQIQDYVGGYENLRTRPERINTDVQISGGFLHAGYPIQGPVSTASGLVNYDTLVTGDWGYFHELGHEMQRRPDKAWGYTNYFTFDGDVEVTVNIFANAALEALVPFESLLQNPSGWRWSGIPEEVMNKAYTTVNNSNSPTFESKDPYPFYFQLSDGFGWETYRDVIQTYNHDYANDRSALPQNNQEKKDQWLIRWSEESGYNMVTYMVDNWGLEVTQGAIDTVNSLNLPDWMPLLAKDDSSLYRPDQSVVISVLDNDLTLDDHATIVGFSQGFGGNVSNNGDGTLTYTPNQGFTDADSFTYTVSNSTGQTDTRTVRLDPILQQIIGEVGQIDSLTHLEQTITLEHNYVNPVIFLQGLSYNESDHAIVRLTDSDSDSFTVKLQEPSVNYDGTHAPESVSYFVFEAGSYTLDDGTKIEVGEYDTSTVATNFDTVNFSQNFSSTPAVFSQVQTNNDPYFVKTRQKSSSKTSVQLALEEDELNRNGEHGTETVGWLAFETGSGSLKDSLFKAGITSTSVNHNWYDLNFNSSFSDTPQFLASIGTYNGSDPSAIRYQGLTSYGVSLKIDEDITKDSETNHYAEKVNYLAYSGQGIMSVDTFDNSNTLLAEQNQVLNLAGSPGVVFPF